MGFFQELKEDLSQAVNELVPEDKFEAEEEVAVAESNLDEDALFAAAEESMGIERAVDIEDMIAASEKLDMAGAPNDLPDSAFVNDMAGSMKQNAGASQDVSALSDDGASEEEAVFVSDEVATVTRMMTVNGDVVSNGSLEVVGAINGNIRILGKLNITGTIKGNSEASEIYAQDAKIDGDIASSGSVKIGNNTVIRGNIYATGAVIAGAVKGDIDVHGPVILDSTAIVMGNIKSKSVQINNGAAIEGMCSQCYAEVSPSNFFRD